jgi:hypothetical protein
MPLHNPKGAGKEKANDIAGRKLVNASLVMDQRTWDFGLCCKKAESCISQQSLMLAARSAQRDLLGRQVCTPLRSDTYVAATLGKL